MRSLTERPRADREEVQAGFRTLCAESRIGFITFHQSYSYEDFMEGIRPVLDAEEERGARYELVNGVFKRLAIDATFDCLEPIGAAPIADFDARWEALVEQIEEDPDRTYPGLTEITDFRLSVTKRGNIHGLNVKTGADFHGSKDYAERTFAAFPDRPKITTGDVHAAVGRGAHASLIAILFQLLKAVTVTPQQRAAVWLHADKAEVVQRFLERRDASGYRLKPREFWRPFVLLIDEINRGNISKIFGELITLLEPDKRLGEAVEIVATLPYSGRRFAVPPNLFVLGTMNTADKSLALLDLALRRRFEFEELQPDFQTACPALPAELRILLEKLNHRIALRRDRDHLIGHAYFVGVSDAAGFDRVFQRRVIPLLQEYFFNDWDGLRAVLGETGASGFIRPLEGRKAAWARNQWQWFHDGGAQLEPHAVLTANYQSAPAPADATADAPAHD